MNEDEAKAKGRAARDRRLCRKGARQAARARGFATTALLSDWRAIAGADLARYHHARPHHLAEAP